MPIKSNVSNNSYTLMDSNLIVTTQGKEKNVHITLDNLTKTSERQTMVAKKARQSKKGRERKITENIVMPSWKKTTFSTCTIFFCIGETRLCQRNRKKQPKNPHPKYISIPNEKTGGVSVKRRIKKRKNRLQNKKPQG